MERDGIASYYQMLKWIVSNDSTYAKAAERIIDGWSGKLTAFAGHDQMLAIGLYGTCTQRDSICLMTIQSAV